MEAIFKSILQTPGLVMLIGPSDSGKTTLAKHLLAELCQQQSCIGFVDSDIGQSTLGPPGTIGGAVFSRFDPTRDWEQQAEQRRLFFIGAFSPPGNFLEMIIGIQKLVEYLRKFNCKTIILDTTGLVQHRAGFYLKKTKIELLKPTHVIFFEKRKDELQTLVQLCQQFPQLTVHHYPVTKDVRCRSQEERQRYREQKINSFFKNSKSYTIKFPPLIKWRKDIVTCSDLAESELKALSTIFRQQIDFASISHRTLILAARRWFYAQLDEPLRKKYAIDSVYVLHHDYLLSKYIALEDNEGNILTLGKIKNIDFYRKTFTIVSPGINTVKIYSIKIGTTNLS